MGEEQALEQIDDQTAIVYYAGGHTAFSITAAAAHDAVGTKVPTTLSVIGSDVITLTVHHRAGDPSAGGTPFDYPIIAGQGWEGGFQTVIVKGPPDEADPREAREREEQEALDAAQSGAASRDCLVPRLKGRSLRASKRRLKKAGCGVGRVTHRKAGPRRTGRVTEQSLSPGVVLNPGAGVNFTLD